MTKSMTISYEETDENFLLALFQKLKIKTSATSASEIDVVRQRLGEKYVVNGTCATMNDEEREDAAHAETIIFAEKQLDYHVYSVEETKAQRAALRQKLTQYADH